MVVSFAASIYAAYNKIQGVTYVVSIILGIILVLYIIGMFLDRKRDDSDNSSPSSPVLESSVSVN
jgi:hypothetical protein